MRTSLAIRHALGALAVAVTVVSTAGCAALDETGSGPVLLIMESVTGSRGGDGTFTTSLLSDVQTLVEVTVGGTTVRQPTTFNDLGRATIRAEMKNTITPTTPTALHAVTISRYRVRFRRTDGQNREGIDIPYGFDGGTTATIAVGASQAVSFDLVRHQAKQEAPLRNLINGGGLRFISTIAEVTFYGRDQAGNEVAITGNIDVQFGDFGDDV